MSRIHSTYLLAASHRSWCWLYQCIWGCHSLKNTASRHDCWCITRDFLWLNTQWLNELEAVVNLLKCHFLWYASPVRLLLLVMDGRSSHSCCNIPTQHHTFYTTSGYTGSIIFGLNGESVFKIFSHECPTKVIDYQSLESTRTMSAGSRDFLTG